MAREGQGYPCWRHNMMMMIYKYLIKYITKDNNQLYKGGLKSLYDNVISVVDDFFDQWDPSAATQIKVVCGLQGKINLIWSLSMRISWLAYEFFCWLLYIYMSVFAYFEFILGEVLNSVLLKIITVLVWIFKITKGFP